MPYAKETPRKSRLRRAMVVGQIAVSVILLLEAGLLIRSIVADAVMPLYLQDVTGLEIIPLSRRSPDLHWPLSAPADSWRAE